MKRSLPQVLPIFLLCTLALLPLRAETANYPEKNPKFSVDVPNGWEAVRDKGTLKLTTNADVVVTFQHVSDAQEDAEAKEGLKTLAEQAGKIFKMTDAEVVTPPGPLQVGMFKGFATEYKGKDQDGQSAFWMCLIFTPEKGNYYLATVVCSDKDDKKTAADRDAIIKSIKPVEE